MLAADPCIRRGRCCEYVGIGEDVPPFCVAAVGLVPLGEAAIGLLPLGVDAVVPIGMAAGVHLRVALVPHEAIVTPLVVVGVLDGHVPLDLPSHSLGLPGAHELLGRRDVGIVSLSVDGSALFNTGLRSINGGRRWRNVVGGISGSIGGDYWR